MTNPHPAPLIPLSNRLLLEITDVVSSFPVKHRHQSGALLRNAAEECALLVSRAWRAGADRPLQCALLQEFIALNDTLKLRLQIAHRLQCFRSSQRFAQIARLARDAGRQASAWKRSTEKHPPGLNLPPCSPAERPLTLSTSATCSQVNA